MRVLFFTSLKAVHSRKWLEALRSEIECHVATFKLSPREAIAGVSIHPILGANPAKEGEQNNTASPEIAPTVQQEAWHTLKAGIRHGRELAKIIDAVKPDLIHAHQSVPFGWYAVRARAASKTKPPLLVSTWGTDVIRYPESHWLFRFLNRVTLSRATRISATGTYLKAKTARWTKNKEISVVPFGVNTGFFVKKLSLPTRATRFGIAKSLKPVYRIDLAIKALAQARQKDQTLTLEIAGDGPERTNLETLVEKLGLMSAVTFLGAVTQAKMPAVMAGWDALLLLTKKESFGVSALEAQAVGLPVLAVREGGIPEVVREGVTARFTSPQVDTVATDMLQLSHDSKLLTSAWHEGPTFVREHYEWRDCVGSMRNIYVEMTS
jgi:glycosyltransferase involved in cell wall biosynthesis